MVENHFENNTIRCQKLASYGVIFKVIFNHTSKRQFVVLLFRNCLQLLLTIIHEIETIAIRSLS